MFGKKFICLITNIFVFLFYIKRSHQRRFVPAFKIIIIIFCCQYSGSLSQQLLIPFGVMTLPLNSCSQSSSCACLPTASRVYAAVSLALPSGIHIFRQCLFLKAFVQKLSFSFAFFCYSIIFIVRLCVPSKDYFHINSAFLINSSIIMSYFQFMSNYTKIISKIYSFYGLFIFGMLKSKI